ncbi:MAG: DNA polymerase I [Chloroflexi bacterium]|nr:DNA polymerase I [Chloroflexota bacterium]MYF81892.1 DNA polymerase I [Chloroflexota bacterium]MYI04011.1 DNA polymerase I [Chloroflexota bacterium]
MTTSNSESAQQASLMTASGDEGGRDDSWKRIVIFDAYALIFRAYFAMQRANLRTSAGEPTGAVRGFTATLLHIFRTLEPTHAAFAFDVDDATVFRREIDPNYKAHREPIPEDLPSQIQRCREIAEAFSVPIYQEPGFEADDVLGTLADQAVAEGFDTWICTLDSDILQLVTDDISVYLYNPYKSEYTAYDGPDAVRARYEVDPIQIIDFKALVGDKSDNIPGVKGVGKVGAVKLLNQYGTVEQIYEHIEEVTPAGTQKKLLDDRDSAFMSKELATIRHDAPVTLDLAAADVTAFDRETVVAKFQELEFRTLMDQIPGLDDQDELAIQQPSVEHYELVTDEAKLQAWVERAARAELLAVDLETSSTDTIDCSIAGYALSDEEGQGCYIPVGHRDDENQLDHDVVKSALRPVLEDSGVPKLLHNAKFDMKVLRRHGINLRGLHDDTMVAAFVLNKSHIGLKSLALSELGVQMTPIEELIGKGRNQLSMVDVSADEAGKYAAADADITLQLANRLLPQLADNEVLETLYRELELPLIPILVDMELAGVTLDTDILDDLDQQLNVEIESVTTQIYEDAGHEFNIGSPKQLSGVLFDQLELPKTRKTSQGYSTDAQQMERLVDAHPIVNRILQWRELTKLRSTYVESLPHEVRESTGRVHTDYNQTVAATGRLSSESPNLQNIPVRTAQGRQIRAAFVARPWDELAHNAEVSFVSADYSQIELRVLAHLSEDEGLLTAFRDGEDIHAATASGAYGVSIDDVQPEMRRVAKMMNFGVIYGLSAHGLSQRSGMERRDAQAFIDAYFGRFERVAQWIEETKESTKERGYAETLLGRRRYLPEINSRNFQRRNAAERMAVNMPVQGTAADVMKRAMIELDDALRARELKSRMLLQVHDELIFEAPSEEIDSLADLLREIMPAALDLVVPLNIEVKSAPNWRDLEPLAVS